MGSGDSQVDISEEQAEPVGKPVCAACAVETDESIMCSEPGCDERASFWTPTTHPTATDERLREAVYTKWDVKEIRDVVRVEGPENHGALMNLADRLEAALGTQEKNDG